MTLEAVSSYSHWEHWFVHIRQQYIPKTWLVLVRKIYIEFHFLPFSLFAPVKMLCDNSFSNKGNSILSFKGQVCMTPIKGHRGRSVLSLLLPNLKNHLRFINFKPGDNMYHNRKTVWLGLWVGRSKVKGCSWHVTICFLCSTWCFKNNSIHLLNSLGQKRNNKLELWNDFYSFCFLHVFQISFDVFFLVWNLNFKTWIELIWSA